MSHRHEEVIDGGRWCSMCNHAHGPLYSCEHYSDALKAQLVGESEAWRARVNNPDWTAEQIANGTPPIVVAIMRKFAGE